MLKFFLNSINIAYLRSVGDKFNESTNAVRLELNRFENAGMKQSEMEGNKKVYTSNAEHPLFVNLQQITRKYVKVDTIIENMISQLG